MVNIIENSSYVLINIIPSVRLRTDENTSPTTWSTNKAAAIATASFYINAYITAARITSSQPTLRFNHFRGFQHISMSTQKFQIYIKPFKNKILDNSPFTVQTKHKTVKLAMFAFIIKPTFYKDRTRTCDIMIISHVRYHLRHF